MYLVLLAAAARAGMAQSNANAHIHVLNTTCTALTYNDCGFGYDVEVANDGTTLTFTSSTGRACLTYDATASGKERTSTVGRRILATKQATP